MLYALIFAVSIIVLGLVLSDISKASTMSLTSEIPYFQIRYTIYELRRAYFANDLSTTNVGIVSANISRLYAKHGYHLNLRVIKVNNVLKYVNMTFMSSNARLRVNASLT